MHGICTECGLATPNEDIILREKADCPQCGNNLFTMRFECSVEFLPNETTLIKQKDPHKSSKKRLRREHFNGMEENHQGKLMRKERLIDKDADIYYEFVQNPETGEVLRKTLESLKKDHTGHGSAKDQKKQT
jgi:predicted  nucleic acid-binding Zn-ribbon protein